MFLKGQRTRTRTHVPDILNEYGGLILLCNAGGRGKCTRLPCLSAAREIKKRKPSARRAGEGERGDSWKEKGFVIASVATGSVLTIVFREGYCTGATKLRERERNRVHTKETGN
jgi:hypothetical protein